MLKIRICSPDPEVEPEVHEFAGASMLIGRGDEADLQVQQGYVSNQHVRILAGIVLAAVLEFG